MTDYNYICDGCENEGYTQCSAALDIAVLRAQPEAAQRVRDDLERDLEAAKGVAERAEEQAWAAERTKREKAERIVDQFRRSGLGEEMRRADEAERRLDEIRGYAEEIQRGTPPGDAHGCAGHIIKLCDTSTPVV